MAYLVLARKWRPQTFSQLLGQEFVSRSLQNAIKLKRVAHAYLFTGSRGVGKTSAARILAKTLNCQEAKDDTVEPCNHCSNCQAISDSTFMDVHEIDGASNTSVDDIRELRENVRFLPTLGKIKIYIIDEVHMLSNNAFNALLKTLEEPPGHVKFIFATTEPHKIPATILSRCQRYDFYRIPSDKITAHLKRIMSEEELNFNQRAAELIAQMAAGSMRDALSLLDQAIAYCSEEINAEDIIKIFGLVDRRFIGEMLSNIASGGIEKALAQLNTAIDKGADLKLLFQEMARYLKDATVVKMMQSEGVSPVKSPDTDFNLQVELDHLIAWFDILCKTFPQFSNSPFPQVVAEMALVKMVTFRGFSSLDKVVSELQEEIGRHKPISANTARTKDARDLPSVKAVDRKSNELKIKKKESSRHHQPNLSDNSQRGDVVDGEEHNEYYPEKEIKEWEEIVNCVRQHNDFLAGLLDDSRVLGFELKNDKCCINIGFPREAYALSKILEQKTCLEKIIEDNFKGRYVFNFIESEDNNLEKQGFSLTEKFERDRRKYRAELFNQAHNNPFIKELQKVFGGEVSKIVTPEGKKLEP